MQRRIIQLSCCPRCGMPYRGRTFTSPGSGEEVCESCSVRESMQRLGLDSGDVERIVETVRRSHGRTGTGPQPASHEGLLRVI